MPLFDAGDESNDEAISPLLTKQDFLDGGRAIAASLARQESAEQPSPQKENLKQIARLLDDDDKECLDRDMARPAFSRQKSRTEYTRRPDPAQFDFIACPMDAAILEVNEDDGSGTNSQSIFTRNSLNAQNRLSNELHSRPSGSGTNFLAQSGRSYNSHVGISSNAQGSVV